MSTPPAFTAHELSALAEQGMPLTEAEEATVRDARGQPAQPVTDINALIAEMRAGLEGVTPGEWTALPWEEEAGGKDWNLWGPKRSNYDYESDLRGDFGNPRDAAHIARCNPANIAGLLDEIERLRADNARLREALAPFAAVVLPASHWQSGWPDYAPLDTAMGSGRASLTIGDCRRAREAMEASNGN